MTSHFLFSAGKNEVRVTLDFRRVTKQIVIQPKVIIFETDVRNRVMDL